MYCIITDNEKIIKYAEKECGKVIEIEKSLVINNKDKINYVVITEKMVQNFFKKFPSIDMKSTGIDYLKYILDKNWGYLEDLESVYPLVGSKFGTNGQTVGSEIMHVYASCITNLPECYKKFFDKYECSIHWDYKHSFDFVKACQKYFEENIDSLMEEKSEEDLLLPFICSEEND